MSRSSLGVCVILSILSLCAVSSQAVTGSIDPSLSPNIVVCNNHTQGITAPGQLLSGGQFDCSGLIRSEGDIVSITLSGPSSGDGGECIEVADIPGSRVVLLGSVTPGQCFTIQGSLSRGFDSSEETPELDAIAFSLAAPASLVLSLTHPPGTEVTLLVAEAGEIIADCSGQLASCSIPTAQGELLLAVAASGATSYTLQLDTAPLAAGGLSSLERENQNLDNLIQIIRQQLGQ